MIEPQSAYGLIGFAQGEDVFIVAPGPSVEGFPLDRLEGRITIGVNAALELFTPRFWMYADKRFSWLYGKWLHERKDLCTVMPYHQAKKLKLYYAGKELWFFHYQMMLRRYGKKGTTPFWFYPERTYLPGRASVFNNALSLAYIMHPRRVVLVGVDFSYEGEDYYAKGVELNPGPRGKERDRALHAGFDWFKSGLVSGRKRVWPGLSVVTTSATLNEKLDRVGLVDVEEALNG